MDPVNCTRRSGQWICYAVRNMQAWELFSGTLDDCRNWAECAGHSGILLGGPSVPWAN